jgi:putative inorganic carbon (HCO3(-)) transporter
MMASKHIVDSRLYPFFFIGTNLVFLFYFFLAFRFGFIPSGIVVAGLFVAAWLGYAFIKNPAYGVALMIVGTSLDVLGRIGGMPVTVFHVGVLLTLIAAGVQILHKGDLRLEGTPFNLPLMLFLLMIAISLLYSPNIQEGAVQLLRIVVLVVLMYAIINAIDKPGSIYLSIFALISSALVLSMISVRSIAGTSTSLIQAAVGFLKVFERYGVTFENPNYLAAFLMLALVMSASLVLNSRARLLLKVALVISSAVIFVALMGTFSRAAWLATCFALMLVVLFSRHRNAILIIGSLVLILTFTVMWKSAFVQSAIVRISTVSDVTGDPSNATRILLFKGGLEMCADSYFLGVGARGFPIVYTKMYRPSTQPLFDVVESHTLPIEILAELGIIGFLLFSVVVYRYFRFAFRSIQEMQHDLLRACQIGLVAGMAGFFVNSLFGPGSLTGNVLYIGFGLTFATHLIAKRTGHHSQGNLAIS